GGQVESALDGSQAAAAAAEAAVLAAYKFERHKSKGQDGEEPENGGQAKEEPELNVFVYSSKKHAADAGEAVEAAVVAARSSNFARDIANEPANFGTPTRLAEVAKQAGKEAGFKVTVLDKADALKLGMGSFLSVAAGSQEPCKFIIMEYDPPKKVR